ncbi:MAG: flagellar protein FlaG [Acidimicrobiia bacterium]
MSLSPISGSPAPVIDLSASFPANNTTNPDQPGVPTPSDHAPLVVAARAPGQGSPSAAKPARIDTEPIRSDLSMEFKWNDTANRLVVVMMDKSTGTVIQQLPPQQVLDLVRDAVKATQEELNR